MSRASVILSVPLSTRPSRVDSTNVSAALEAIEPDASRTLESRTHLVVLDREGILRTSIKRGDVGLDDAKETVRLMTLLAAGTSRPLLGDMAGARAMSREARTYFVQDCDCVSAAALIVRSPLERAIGNFFLGLNLGSRPARLFPSEAAALVWLRSYL
jgi:hypothetical protein